MTRPTQASSRSRSHLALAGLALLTASLWGCGGNDAAPATADNTSPVPTNPAPDTGAGATSVPVSAAAGGTVQSADQQVEVNFPADAFTADTVVTIRPLTDAETPALPTTEGFSDFQPVPGTYYRLSFAGGSLRPGVEVSYGWRSGSEVSAQPASVRVRSQAVATANVPNNNGVVACDQEVTVIEPQQQGSSSYGTGAVSCGPNPSRSLEMGRVVLAPTPSTTLDSRTLGRAPNYERLDRVINHPSGRIAFGYSNGDGSGDQMDTQAVAVLTAGGTLVSTNRNAATLIGFDGNLQLLTMDYSRSTFEEDGMADCRPQTQSVRISNLLGTTIGIPRWTGPNLAINGYCGFPRSAARPGGGWVVSNYNRLTWLDAQGQAQYGGLSVSVTPNGGNTYDVDIMDMAMASTGKLWVLGVAGDSYVANDELGCIPQLSGSAGLSRLYCHVLVEVDVTGGTPAVTDWHTLGAVKEVIGERSTSRLYVDGNDRALVAIRDVESSVSGSGRLSLRRFAPTGGNVADVWGLRLPEAWGVDPGGIAVDTSGDIYVSTREGSLGGSVTQPATQLGSFVFRVKDNGSFDDLRQIVPTSASGDVNRGIGIDTSGVLTFIGQVLNRDDEFGSHLDILIKRFRF